jgi:integrase
MASFTKRNGRWRARVRRADLPSLTKSFPTKTLALKWSQRVESDPEEFLPEQVSADHQLVTLGDLLRKYGEEVTPRKKGRDKEKYRIRILERSLLSGVSLRNLKSHHITRFREDRLKEVSAGTVLKDLGLLSAVINTGRTEWGLENVIRTNPVSLISKPRAPRARDRRLEAGELEKLLGFNSSSNNNSWFRPVIIFAIETGMRRGEILSLCWGNVHLEKRYVHLPDTKNGDSRDVPLSALALELLGNLPRNISSDQVVFPLHFEALKSAWRRACSKADIIGLRFHDLRHEATSRFFEKGLNVMEVAAITGHKDLRMLQRYTHLRAEDLALKLA